MVVTFEEASVELTLEELRIIAEALHVRIVNLSREYPGTHKDHFAARTLMSDTIKIVNKLESVC